MAKLVKQVVTIAAIAAGTALGGPIGGLIAGALATVATNVIFKPKGPKASPADRSRLQADIDPRTPRKIVFGRTAMATDIRDEEFTGTDQEYLHRFIVCASHKVNAIEEIWFDNKLAWTSGGGVQGEFVGYLDVTAVLEGNSGNAINISSRMGTTRRYTGLAYVYFRYKLTGNTKKAESPFASSITTRITIIGQGIPCYDPRQDSTAGGSGAHRADDQSTWTYGTHARNPACQSLTYMLGWRIAGKLAVGKGIPARRFDMAAFITAANICDETVALAGGGTEPRYRSDGIFSEADDMSLVIGQFSATMDARFYDPQGRIAVRCMVYEAPAETFTADDLLGDIDWKPFADLGERYNIVRGTYTDARTESLYQSIDYPESAQASHDGIDRIFPLDLPLVQSPTQAQRLAKRKRLRFMNGGGILSGEMQATAWRVGQFDTLALDFAPLGMTGKEFRVEEIATRVDGVVPVVLTVEGPEIYEWDEDADEADAVTPVDAVAYDPANNPLLLESRETARKQAIAGSYTSGLAGNITQALNGSGAVTVTIPTHYRIYSGFPTVSVTGGNFTLAYDEEALFYYDDPTLAGGSVSIQKTDIAADAYYSEDHPYRHHIGFVTAINSGGTGGTTGGSTPPGGGGWTGNPDYNVP